MARYEIPVVWDVESDPPEPLGIYDGTEEDVVFYLSRGERSQAPEDCVVVATAVVKVTRAVDQDDRGPILVREKTDAPRDHGTVTREIAEYRDGGARIVVCELRDGWHVVEVYRPGVAIERHVVEALSEAREWALAQVVR